MKKEKIIAITIFILSFIFSIGFFLFRDYFKGMTSLGLLGLFLINFVSSASLFISAPSMINVFAGGAIYPPILVALVSSLGSAFGDLISFILGLSGRNLINHNFHKKLWFRFLEDFFKKHGSWILFIFAFIPNPIFDSIGILAGAFSYPPLKFFLIVFAGRLIRYFLLAEAGRRF